MAIRKWYFIRYFCNAIQSHGVSYDQSCDHHKNKRSPRLHSRFVGNSGDLVFCRIKSSTIVRSQNRTIRCDWGFTHEIHALTRIFRKLCSTVLRSCWIRHKTDPRQVTYRHANNRLQTVAKIHALKSHPYNHHVTCYLLRPTMNVLHHDLSEKCRHFIRSSILALTHWGRLTHICDGELTIIVSDNGLSPRRRHTIILTNAGILLIEPYVTNFSEILIETLTISFMKMSLKVSSAKWWPFSLGLNVLI